jgi:hypothetical protein
MVNKTISLPEEVAKRLLEEDNASALISELLRDHYSLKDAKELTPEEIDKRIAVLKIKLEAKKKIENIENGTTN